MSFEYKNFMSNLQLAKSLGVDALLKSQNKEDKHKRDKIWVNECRTAFTKAKAKKLQLLHPQSLLSAMKQLHLKYETKIFLDEDALAKLGKFSRDWYENEKKFYLSDLSDFEHNDDTYTPKRCCLIILAIAQEEGWTFELNKEIDESPICTELVEIAKEIRKNSGDPQLQPKPKQIFDIWQSVHNEILDNDKREKLKYKCFKKVAD